MCEQVGWGVGLWGKGGESSCVPSLSTSNVGQFLLLYIEAVTANCYRNSSLKAVANNDYSNRENGVVLVRVLN